MERVSPRVELEKWVELQRRYALGHNQKMDGVFLCAHLAALFGTNLSYVMHGVSKTLKTALSEHDYALLTQMYARIEAAIAANGHSKYTICLGGLNDHACRERFMEGVIAQLRRETGAHPTWLPPPRR